MEWTRVILWGLGIALAILGAGFMFLWNYIRAELPGKVGIAECRKQERAFSKRVDELKAHFDTRFDDFKDFIRQNGFPKAVK